MNYASNMNIMKTCQSDQLFINTIRGLSIDAVQKANSGHPGLPLGVASVAYTLWFKHMNFNSKNPDWFNRDRFVLSAGHGSALLYSLLHLAGYDLSLDDLNKFRRLWSKTPGHPENHITPGVEMATGPLGQGVATAVGMAIAEKHLSSKFNRDRFKIVDHYTYVICSDGDLMEGVAQEACSLAGHLGLGKLILLYDDNNITIDGCTDITFTEDVSLKFQAMGWHVICNVDGNSINHVHQSIAEAKSTTGKPSLIICKTTIGFGSPNRANTSKVHGAPLGDEEVMLTKQNLGIPEDKLFYVPEEVVDAREKIVEKGIQLEKLYQIELEKYAVKYPDLYHEFISQIEDDSNTNWKAFLPHFSDAISTRAASQKVIASISNVYKNLVGGSADLNASVLCGIPNDENFQKGTPSGRNICFGIREHAMAACVNGINLHKGLRAYGGTFLVFSDYCRPSIRLSAIMNCPSIFLFSHDSIGLGEDGPTHQPIEHLSSLRAIPNLHVLRPADGNETSACWKLALEEKNAPSILALSRQALPSISSDNIENHPAKFGGYVIKEFKSTSSKMGITLLSTGSEVSLCINVGEQLSKEGLDIRVVSMPCVELFELQSEEYKKSVLPNRDKTLAVECGSSMCWYRYAKYVFGIDRFGGSGNIDELMTFFGFTKEKISEYIRTKFEIQ